MTTFAKMVRRVSILPKSRPTSSRPTSSGARRFNKIDPKSKNCDAEQLKEFFSSHGVTAHDVDIAFDMLSSNKKTVNHNDLKAFIAKYFDYCPEEAISILNNWKEEVTKDQFMSALVSRTLTCNPYENALKVIAGFTPVFYKRIRFGRSRFEKVLCKNNR
jgi:hypothetical protein